MNKYVVRVTEVLCREIEIEAENSEEACVKAEEMYSNSDVVLDYNDFQEVEFNVVFKEVSPCNN